MASLSYAILGGRGLVAVSGPDARPFLQGIISQDMDRVGPTSAAYGALLTAQGKFLHDFLIVELDDVVLLDCEAARADDLTARLGRYKLRSRVELALATDRFEVAALWGEGAPAALGLPAEPGAARTFAGGIAFIDPRIAELGVRAILPAGRGAAAIADAGFASADFAAYDAHRLRLAVPDGSRDMVPERSLLLECNLDLLNGISWEKGCYVGQELTARTYYRRLVKRRLTPVEIDGPTPPPGTPVIAGGDEVGKLYSALDGRGLAVIRLAALDPVEDGGMTAGEARLTPVSAPWAERARESQTA